MSMNKKITQQIANMPKYQITDEAYENQALARTQAFGRNRALQMQEENIAQQGAVSAGQARKVSNSTNQLLSTISAINANTNQSLRGLAQDEAVYNQQNVGQLLGVNSAMIDEKDKQWRQNVYAPWDAKLRDLQRKKANRDRILADIGNGVLGAAQSFLGGSATSGSGSASGTYNSYVTGGGGGI